MASRWLNFQSEPEQPELVHCRVFPEQFCLHLPETHNVCVMYFYGSPLPELRNNVHTDRCYITPPLYPVLEGALFWISNCRFHCLYRFPTLCVSGVVSLSLSRRAPQCSLTDGDDPHSLILCIVPLCCGIMAGTGLKQWRTKCLISTGPNNSAFYLRADGKPAPDDVT